MILYKPWVEGWVGDDRLNAYRNLEIIIAYVKSYSC
jgi:hypothetical protein